MFPFESNKNNLISGHSGQSHFVVDPEGGGRARYDGAKRKMDSKAHMAADALGDLLALLVTSVNEQDRDQVQPLTQKAQEVTGETVEVAFGDGGYTLLL